MRSRHAAQRVRSGRHWPRLQLDRAGAVRGRRVKRTGGGFKFNGWTTDPPARDGVNVERVCVFPRLSRPPRFSLRLTLWSEWGAPPRPSPRGGNFRVHRAWQEPQAENRETVRGVNRPEFPQEPPREPGDQSRQGRGWRLRTHWQVRLALGPLFGNPSRTQSIVVYRYYWRTNPSHGLLRCAVSLTAGALDPCSVSSEY